MCRMYWKSIVVVRATRAANEAVPRIEFDAINHDLCSLETCAQIKINRHIKMVSWKSVVKAHNIFTYVFIDGSSCTRRVIASDKLFVSLRPSMLPLMQVRCALRGLIEMLLMLLLNESFRDANTSVCVACVFFTFRFSFSINSESVFNFATFANGSAELSGNFTFSWAYWWPWCNWWWCKCSVELLAFLPPIKRSWLFVVLSRDTERSTDKSSNEVNVCERAKLTCFVLQMEIHLSLNFILITLII